MFVFMLGGQLSEVSPKPSQAALECLPGNNAAS